MRGFELDGHEAADSSRLNLIGSALLVLMHEQVEPPWRSWRSPLGLVKTIMGKIPRICSQIIVYIYQYARIIIYIIIIILN